MNSLFSYQRKCYKYQENKKFARTILGHSVLLLKKYKSIYYLFLTSWFFFFCLFVCFCSVFWRNIFEGHFSKWCSFWRIFFICYSNVCILFWKGLDTSYLSLTYLSHTYHLQHFSTAISEQYRNHCSSKNIH